MAEWLLTCDATGFWFRVRLALSWVLRTLREIAAIYLPVLATRLAEELARQGHSISQRSICALLAELCFSLQLARKTREAARNPARDVQFSHIGQTVSVYQATGGPVISVDSRNPDHNHYELMVIFLSSRSGMFFRGMVSSSKLSFNLALIASAFASSGSARVLWKLP